MSNYENILISLGFKESNGHFTRNGEGRLYSIIMRGIYDYMSEDILKIYENDNNLDYIIRVRITETNLSINFIYDSGNSEHVININKFDTIFTRLLRDFKLDQLL